MVRFDRTTGIVKVPTLKKSPCFVSRQPSGQSARHIPVIDRIVLNIGKEELLWAAPKLTFTVEESANNICLPPLSLDLGRDHHELVVGSAVTLEARGWAIEVSESSQRYLVPEDGVWARSDEVRVWLPAQLTVLLDKIKAPIDTENLKE